MAENGSGAEWHRLLSDRVGRLSQNHANCVAFLCSSELEPSTNDTGRLIQMAMGLAEAAFKPGYEYLKAKVIATELSPNDQVQGSLLGPSQDSDKREKLMQAMDSLSRRFSKDMVKFGAVGLNSTWALRANYLSPEYTTQWEEIPVVKVGIVKRGGNC